MEKTKEITKKITVDEMHKEIDLLQSCIDRMAKNSFMIKGWFVSIYAVILALLPEKVDVRLLCVVLIVVNILFWYLDGVYLRDEKIYRRIYQWVVEARKQNDRELMYQLELNLYKNKIGTMDSVGKIMFSKSLFIFYAIPLAVLVVVMGFNVLNVLIKIH